MLEPYKQLIRFVWFYSGKMWIFFKKRPVFFFQIWPDWENTTWAAMARLGSIGLTLKPKNINPS